MVREKSSPPAETRWVISMDWFTQNSRSFVSLLSSYLCTECEKRLRGSKKEPTPQVLMATIKKCCAQEPDFVNQKTPVLESCFRVLLRNGNQPLTLQEMAAELARLRSLDISTASPAALERILKNDGYYGLTEV